MYKYIFHIRTFKNYSLKIKILSYLCCTKDKKIMAKKIINPPVEVLAETKQQLPDEERPLENNPLLKKIFIAAFAVICLLTFFWASKTGINADEDFQVKYSESLVNWYGTLGKDTTATNLMYRKAPMHYYGGFFEVIAGATNKALGNTPDDVPYHTTRHFLVAIFGLLTMLFTGLAAREVAGWRAGLIALCLISFSPYFIGNAVMNPKDIPFALGFAMATYYSIIYLRDMPAPRKRIVTGLIISFIIAIGTRAGGLLLVAYFGLFNLVHIFRNYQLSKFFGNRGLLWSYVRSGLTVTILGYLGALLFWPFGLIKPFKNPLTALSEFEKFSTGIRVLYKGTNVFSDSAPNDYAYHSILVSTPLIVIIGFVLGVVGCYWLLKKFNQTAVFIALFASIFPVCYVIWKDSNMYNNWRHILFVYPAMILTATLFFTYLYEFLNKKNKYLGFGLLAVIGASLLPPALHIVQNSAMPYYYYNAIVGGEKGAYGNYEADYWGISMREGTEYLEKTGVFNQANAASPVVVATNMGYAGRIYLSKKYGDKVKVMYVAYSNRYSMKWDYGLFLSLFTDGSQLRAGKWPMQSSIYTVRASGNPVLAVMKQDTSQICFKANEAIKKNDAQTAITLLNQAVAQAPDNEWALENLSNVAIATQDFATAKRAAEMRLQLSPEDSEAVGNLGYTMTLAGEFDNAIALLNRFISKNPNDATAYMYLGMAQAQKGDLKTGLRSVEKSVKIKPTPQALALLAQLYDATGNKAAAQNIRQQLQ
jgi:Flp pilus assembly protein TadD